MEIINELEKFLLSESSFDGDRKSIGLDEDLLMLGIIDSMGILKLVAFIEVKYGIKIKNEDILPENFQNLNSLKKFIEKKIKN
jgi:acyl carrier protein